MIVDDSVVARSVLSRMIESDDLFEIAAIAGTAEDAWRSAAILDAVLRSQASGNAPARIDRPSWSAS